MNTGELIRQYVSNLFHLSLATSLNGQPWICEVHYVYDDDLNFYFLSKPSRRHSKEIAANPKVAGNIVKQHSATETPRGVYFEGTAELLKNVAEDSAPFNLYDQRFGLSAGIREEIKADPEGHKFYKIMPTHFMLFDPVNFPDNPRQEWKTQ